MQSITKPRRTDVSSTEMARSFDRYKKEEPQPVRQADVQGTEIEKLRKRREMLLSTDPELAKTIIEFHRDLTFFEALALAKIEGKLIVPNSVHDRILTETTDFGFLGQVYKQWARTGTLIIHEKPDKPFGGQVRFKGITFHVPYQFRGKANCALAAEYPDFELVDLGKNKFEIKLVEGANIYLVECFPNRGGWYKSDPGTLIPQGEPSAESKDTRLLWRSDSASICLLVRLFDVCGHDGRQVVDAYAKSLEPFRVALL